MPDDETLYDDEGRIHDRKWHGGYKPRWSVWDQDYERSNEPRERDPSGYTESGQPLYRTRSGPTIGSGGDGGAGDSAAIVIALLIIAAVTAVVFFLVRLVVKGFDAAQKGDWSTAFLHWSLPLVLVVVTIGSQITAQVRAATRAHEAREAAELRQEQIEMELSKIAGDYPVVLNDIHWASCEALERCESRRDNSSFIIFTVLNRWRGHARIGTDLTHLGLTCQPRQSIIPADSQVEFTCRIQGSAPEEVCLDVKLGVPGNDILSQTEIPAQDICATAASVTESTGETISEAVNVSIEVREKTPLCPDDEYSVYVKALLSSDFYEPVDFTFQWQDSTVPVYTRRLPVGDSTYKTTHTLQPQEDRLWVVFCEKQLSLQPLCLELAAFGASTEETCRELPAVTP